jgi:hypothetical protein
VTDEPEARPRARLLGRLSVLGPSSQAAIPGIYAWAVTVAPAAWARGASAPARVAAVVGLLALVTAPLVEGGMVARPPRASQGAAAPRGVAALRTWSPAAWARLWSIWGLVLSSAIVWALSPGALSAARLDGVQGALGMVGWALFAFASAGPALRAEPDAASRIVAGTPLKPRSELPRGDGVYVAVGVVAALALQAIGWKIASPERAVLVRLVTVTCGIAVLAATTSIGLARHAARVPAPPTLRLRRGLPWVAFLSIAVGAGAALTMLAGR